MLNALREAERQRDELVAAMEAIVDYKSDGRYWNDNDTSAGMRDIAKAALAKAEGDDEVTATDTD